MDQRNVLHQPGDESLLIKVDVVAIKLVREDLFGLGAPRGNHCLVQLNGCHLQAEVFAHELVEVLPRDRLRLLLEEVEAESGEGGLDVPGDGRSRERDLIQPLLAVELRLAARVDGLRASLRELNDCLRRGNA